MFDILRLLGLAKKHLPLLKKHWALTIAGGLAAVIGFQNIYADEPISMIPLPTIPYIQNELSVSTTKFDTLQKRYDDLVDIAEERRERIVELEDQNAVYEKQVTIYNKAVGAWKQKTRVLEKRNTALEDEINSFRAKWSSDVDEIINGVVAQTCEEAMETLRKDSEVLKWKK